MSTRRALEFVLPGDIRAATGGYIYDRRIVEGLESLGWRVTVHSLDSSFPNPTDAALAGARSTLQQLPDGAIVVIDGLALGGMPDLLAEQNGRLRLAALIHHPLALETGLSPERQRKLDYAEQRALAGVDRIIVTSSWTMRRLIDQGVPSKCVHAVVPGTDPAPLARGSGDTPLKLLCVATLTPRKGHSVLLEALEKLRDRSWHLDCVGSLQRDPETGAAVRGQIKKLGLTGRVTLLGEIADELLAEQYARADLFVLATHLEGYGMALTEALSRGIPVVSTTAGAVPDTVPADAALLVPPGDSAALAEALATLMDDPAARNALARGARRARSELPTWDEASVRFAAALEGLA